MQVSSLFGLNKKKKLPVANTMAQQGTLSKGKKEFVAPAGPLIGSPMPKNFEVIERYALTPPFAYAVIAHDPAQKLPYYYTDELELSAKETVLYNNIIAVLQIETQSSPWRSRSKEILRNPSKEYS